MRGARIVLLALSACGSSAPSGYADFRKQAGQLLCQHSVDCGLLDAAYQSWCENNGDQSTGPDPATYSYDRNAAAACFDALKQAHSSCKEIDFAALVLYYACTSAAFTGKTPVGGSCPFGIECAPGSRCIGSPGTGPCSRKCVSIGMVGQSCTSDTCADGAYCDSSAGLCKAQLDNGAACPNSAGCQNGLYCVGAMPTMTCAAPGGSGAPCVYDPTSCAGDLVCDEVNLTCIAAKQAGAACSSDLECASPMFCFTATGFFPGTCQLRAAKGASCAATACISPYLCMNGICVVPPDIGEPCNSTCLNGYCGRSQVCEPLVAVGGPCDPTELFQCQGNANCDPTSKTCQLCQ